MRDELLALIEDGPKETGQLIEWLAQPPADVRRTLRELKREGVVKTVGTSKRWALISHVSQGGPKRRAQISPSTVLRDRRRQQKAQTPAPAVHEPELLEADDLIEADPDAELAERVLEQPALRQRSPAKKAKVGKDAPASWWLGKSREEFSIAAAARDQEMRQTSPEWKRQITKGLHSNE